MPFFYLRYAILLCLYALRYAARDEIIVEAARKRAPDALR